MRLGGDTATTRKQVGNLPGCHVTLNEQKFRVLTMTRLKKNDVFSALIM